MERSKKHIGILGGGPCGLYAGRVLSRQGFQVTLLDKGERPGGLATGFRCGDNWYDVGVHMLHSFDQEIFQDIKQIMGDELIPVKLNARIKWAGGSYRYPLQFQDMIKGIPFFKLCYQVVTLFQEQIKNYISPWEPENAEEALIQLYGKPLYKFFFEDFTHRYWDIHPRELSASFVKTKMPKLSAVDVLKKGLGKIGIKQPAQSVASALTTETLHYSISGAEAMPRALATAIAAANGNVIQNAEVKQIITDGQQVVSILYQQHNQLHKLNCDAYISTIPLNKLIHCFQPQSPSHVLEAAQFIKYKSIVIYGLLVKKPQCFDALYIYYRDRIFHRIGEPKNAGLKVNPPDHTLLIIEMTCEPNDTKWRGDENIKKHLLKDLSEEGVCEQQDVVEMHIIPYEIAYPIFTLGFEPHLENINSYLNQFSNLVSAGRQGAFTYPNMHKAMRMGWKAADKIVESCKVLQEKKLEVV